MTHLPASARRAAVYMLDQILGEGRLLSDLITNGALDRLDPAERATAQRLTVNTLRGLERVDRLLKRHLRKAPALHIHNILRLGTCELCHGGDAHGVVSELVTIAGANKRHEKLKGLVNAILRKMADDGTKSWKDLRIPRLPDWLRVPLTAAYGNAAMLAMEQAHFAGAPLDLTPRDPQDASNLATRLNGDLLPSGSIRLHNPGQVSALPGFETGEWWVQDAAAAIPTQILKPQQGERILDLCAAPGGKTLQLAAAGAQVTALDLSKARMGRVTENLQRTGLKATCLTEDALTHDDGPYDAILLDAPCSATGTIRRHPDLPHAKDGAEFAELIALQSAMLDHALSLLAPGGRLIFCTCSLLPDEGECQVEDALARHSDIKADPEALNIPGVLENWITEEGGLRLRPDYWANQGGMDGFYIACLRKGTHA